MSRRDNQEWIEALRGQRGYTQLEVVHQDLARYSYKVALNYLKYRQGIANPYILKSFTKGQLGALAEDFVQDTLEKLIRDDYALLDKFHGKGTFTSWIAVVVVRVVARELRRAEWNLPKEALDDAVEDSGKWEPDPWDDELSQAFQECLDKLTESRKRALWSRIVEERSAEEVAKAMNKTEAAIYSLVSKGKKDLKKCLEKR